MTLNRLPGIYFVDEVVNTLATEVAEDEVLTFVLCSNTAIDTLDNQLVRFTDFNSFKTITNGKGLDKTVAFIESVLAETGHTEFYAYKVQGNTVDNWNKAITSSTHLKENRRFIYFEETTAPTSFPLSNIVAAMKNACNTCYEFGAFRTLYVIPYANVNGAISGADEGVAKETVVINTFNTLTSAEGSGRVIYIVPDLYSQMMSTIINAGYSEESGYPVLSGSVESLEYNFTYEQMVQLQNMGVIFARPERVNGEYQYRINLGVTSSFKESKADGLLVDRLIADEVLHRIDTDCTPNIKQKESDAGISIVQATVDNIISEFVASGDITTNTVLTVSDAGEMKYKITGTIETVKTLALIEVSVAIA